MLKKLSSIIFKKPFHGKSLVNQTRLDFMKCLVANCLKLDGSLIELGVYRGGSLFEIASVLKLYNSTRTLFAVDTFTGHPYTDNRTTHIKGRFSDVNLNRIKYLIKKKKYNKNIELLKGTFKDILPKISNYRFCFAHVDCDLYQSYVECLEFLMPRMNKGSIIWLDDYNSKSATLANKAIHKFIPKNKLIILPKKQAYYIFK